MAFPASTTADNRVSFFVPDAGRGLVTVTRLSDGLVTQAFCPAPARNSASNLTWTDTTFQLRASDFLSDASTPTTYYTTARGGSWGHGAVATRPLLATESGFMRLKYVAGQGAAGVIGLHDSAVLVPQPQMRFCFYVEPTGTLSIFHTAAGGSQEVLSTNIQATDGWWYAMGRTDRQVYILGSADGVNFSRLYTYAAGYNQGGTMYWVFDINADAPYHLLQPQYAYA